MILDVHDDRIAGPEEYRAALRTHAGELPQIDRITAWITELGKTIDEVTYLEFSVNSVRIPPDTLMMHSKAALPLAYTLWFTDNSVYYRIEDAQGNTLYTEKVQ